MSQITVPWPVPRKPCQPNIAFKWHRLLTFKSIDLQAGSKPLAGNLVSFQQKISSCRCITHFFSIELLQNFSSAKLPYFCFARDTPKETKNDTDHNKNKRTSISNRSSANCRRRHSQKVGSLLLAFSTKIKTSIFEVTYVLDAIDSLLVWAQKGRPSQWQFVSVTRFKKSVAVSGDFFGIYHRQGSSTQTCVPESQVTFGIERSTLFHKWFHFMGMLTAAVLLDPGWCAMIPWSTITKSQRTLK